jgi:hypothetical protein
MLNGIRDRIHGQGAGDVPGFARAPAACHSHRQVELVTAGRYICHDMKGRSSERNLPRHCLVGQCSGGGGRLGVTDARLKQISDQTRQMALLNKVSASG